MPQTRLRLRRLLSAIRAWLAVQRERLSRDPHEYERYKDLL